MKVLLTHELFLPDFAGGGEYVVMKTAQHLMQRGAQVQVVTTGDPKITSYEGIPTVRLPIQRYRFNLAVGKIIELARDVDVIQTFPYHACLPSLVAAKWLGKPIVCTMLSLFHNAWREMRGPVVGTAFMAWERFLVTRAFSRITFMSEYSRELAESLGVRSGFPILPSSIEPHEYFPDTEKDNVVLFVGKFDVRKGVFDVLSVARALPHVQFKMLGWGPLEEVVRREAPPNIEFLPYDHDDELRRVFARASIFMLPSKGEGFPVALLQAMASGCAVIFTLPLPFAGVTVNPGDVPGLIQAVRQLTGDPAEARRMGRRNAELAQAYSWDRYTTMLLRIYEEVLNEQAFAASARMRGRV